MRRSLPKLDQQASYKTYLLELRSVCRIMDKKMKINEPERLIAPVEHDCLWDIRQDVFRPA